MANFSFYIQIELDNPYQVSTSEYSYIYASQEDSPSLQILDEFDLADGIANELENYYEGGSIIGYNNVYPKYRGPGGGGISASSFLPSSAYFAGPYSPNGYLKTIEFSFDADKINAVPGSVDKIATDVKKIIEGVFANATASTKEVYLDPIFTYYTSRRASNSPTSSNGQQNNRYTPHGKTFSFPFKPVYQKTREEKVDSTYNIRYKLSGIITIEDWEKNYKSLADSSRKQYGVNTQTQETPQTGLSPSGQTPSQTPTPPQTPTTQTLSVSGDTQANGLTPSGMSPSAAGLTPSGMTPSPPPEPPIKGVFVLNIEKPGILSCTALGDLTITQKELGVEDFFYFGEETDYGNEEVDDEYSEGAYAGAEEDLAFEVTEGKRLSQGQELLTNFDMSNPETLKNNDTKNGDPNVVESAPNVNTTATGKIKKMIEIAKGQVGYVEKTGYPQHNGKDSKFGAYFGMNGYHWCGMFVGWCCNQAGMVLSTKDFNAKNGNICNAISCVCGVSVAKKKGVWVSNGDSKSARQNSSIKPDPGDIVFFSWDFNNSVDHVGIVVEDAGNGYVNTVEGNTAGGSKGGANQKGAGVWEKKRQKACIIGYCKTALYDPTNLNEFTGVAPKKSAKASEA